MLPTLVTTWTTHFIEARTTALHVQLVTELYLYRLHIFNKIEISRLDSTLSVFVIIRTIHTLSISMNRHQDKTLSAQLFHFN